MPLLQPGPQPSLALTLALESCVAIYAPQVISKEGSTAQIVCRGLIGGRCNQTQTSGRCSLARLGKFVARCFKRSLIALCHSSTSCSNCGTTCLTHCERATVMHSCSHFASQAHSRSAQQQRPENLPTHRRPASGWPEPEPVRPFPPPRLFLSLATTLPTLLSAAAFCHTDDLRYGCSLKRACSGCIYFRTVSL